MSIRNSLPKLFGGTGEPKPNRAERRLAAKTHQNSQYDAARMERAQARKRKEDKAAAKREQKKRMRDSKHLGIAQTAPR